MAKTKKHVPLYSTNDRVWVVSSNRVYPGTIKGLLSRDTDLYYQEDHLYAVQLDGDIHMRTELQQNIYPVPEGS